MVITDYKRLKQTIRAITTDYSHNTEKGYWQLYSQNQNRNKIKAQDKRKDPVTSQAKLI